MNLPKELIDDYESGVMIANLCKKYELPRHVVRNQLIEIGAKKENTWGGRRSGCGRKRRERGSELKTIRDKKVKLNKPTKGVKVRPKFRLW